ncbi:MAG: hypothetical protein FWB72_01175 [Firmicutes bacterium]|nr:hypothetical protein [Bacillota bacterium]
MNSKAKEKFLQKRKKAQDFLNFMVVERGITSEKFYDSMDIVKRFSLEQISKALTHYCFRNGPVENMHAAPNSKLSDADMKTLNKFCVDKIFTFLTMMKNNKVAELTEIIEFGIQYGSNWDEPQYREGD